MEADVASSPSINVSDDKKEVACDPESYALPGADGQLAQRIGDVMIDDSAWKERLTENQYRVLRKKVTVFACT